MSGGILSFLANKLQLNGKIWQEVAERNVADILPVTAWVLTIINIIYAVAHHFLLPPQIAALMTPIAASIALTIILTDILQPKVPSHLVMLFYGALNLIPCMAIFYLRQNALETTNFMIVAVAAASLMVSARYFVIMLLLVIGSWAAVAFTLPMTDELVHFAFAMFATTALSVIVYMFRRNNLLTMEALRLKEHVHQKELLRSAKMVALGEMASGIAHEINNPLMIIMTKADNLKRAIQQPSEDPNKALADIERIEVTVQRIAKIIKGLSIFSRKSDIDPKQSSALLEIVDDTLGLCQQKLKKHDIRVHVEIEPKTQVFCRPPEISQVLLNLIGNAIDAIQTYDDRWIRLSVREMGGFVEFRVIDSGHRISPEIQQQIMQPFFTTKELGRGTGLGLSISKSIVEDHGGRLLYDSEFPNTCFVLTLPMTEAVLWNKASSIDLTSN